MVHIELVSLSGVKLSKDAYEVTLPTMNGRIAVFNNHASLITVAVPGEVYVRSHAGQNDDDMDSYVVSGGVIDIADNTVRVLVDEADQSSEIDLDAAQKAYERAQELKRTATDQVTIQKAQEMMDLSSIRLSVATLKRRRNR